ncbi:MAG: bis(5'-nucleosyl)-tetraphosphatase (symmetrical) YqeK [Limnochordales bacterium]|nr:bis(5'-nucleosyl)-tetraphosphatase (symmetrical) YqeK [Limnochordales bacterium]
MRRAHVEGVVQTCASLCRRFDEPEYRGRLAAWVHDLAREWPAERLLQQAEAFGIVGDDVEREMPFLLHGPVIAAWVRQEWGLDDIEILKAVANHTTGRPGMGRLELILYVADAIEPGRSFAGVEELRRLASDDLERAALAISESMIHYLLGAGLLIHPQTLLTRNDLLRRVRARSGGNGVTGWKTELAQSVQGWRAGRGKEVGDGNPG